MKYEFTFASQVKQYARRGPRGIGYLKAVLTWAPDKHVDCLLFRDKHGIIRGILNHFPYDFPDAGEKAGNVAIFVDERFKRRGIAGKLLDLAHFRWGINFEQQMYSPEGGAFIIAYLRSRGIEPGGIALGAAHPDVIRSRMRALDERRGK